MLKLKVFTAEWCGPCKVLKENLTKLWEEKSLGDRIEWETVDVDKNPDVALSYGVSSLPTLIIDNGKVVLDMLVGNYPVNKVYRFIMKNINNGD